MALADFRAQADRVRELNREIDDLSRQFDRLTAQEDRLLERLPPGASLVSDPDDLSRLLSQLDADIVTAQRAEEEIEAIERLRDQNDPFNPDDALDDQRVDRILEIEERVLSPISGPWDTSDSDELKRLRRKIEKIQRQWRENLARQDEINSRIIEIENELLAMEG